MSVLNLMVDDLDSTVIENVETFSFSFNGTAYLVDLGKTNAEAMFLAFEPYITVARKDEIKKTSAAPAAKGSTRDTKPIREWAKANGHTVGEKGRIAAGIEKAYNDAMAKQADDASKATAKQAEDQKDEDIVTPEASSTKPIRRTKAAV